MRNIDPQRKLINKIENTVANLHEIHNEMINGLNEEELKDARLKHLEMCLKLELKISAIKSEMVDEYDRQENMKTIKNYFKNQTKSTYFML